MVKKSDPAAEYKAHFAAVKAKSKSKTTKEAGEEYKAHVAKSKPVVKTKEQVGEEYKAHVAKSKPVVKPAGEEYKAHVAKSKEKPAADYKADYKAHWESTWKVTADQARARKIVEAAKAATTGRSTVRRRGRGYGGGQFT